MLRKFFVLFVLASIIAVPVFGQDTATKPPAASAFMHLQSHDLMSQLDAKASLDFIDTPLVEVLDTLVSKCKLPMELDVAALELAGIDREEPVTFSQQDMRLEHALRHMCRQLELGLVPDRSRIVVTTLEQAEQMLTIVNYPVWDLVKAGEDDKQVDYDSLIELITSTTHPDTWEEVGGAAGLVGHKGILSISQMYDVHQEIAMLLDGLRRLPIASEAKPSDLPIAIVVNGNWSREFSRMLESEMDFEFIDVPLSEMAEAVSSKVKLPVLIDMAALDQAGIDPDEPVNGFYNKMKVSESLSRLLAKYDLTYLLRDGSVMITTLEQAEEQLEIRLYPVAGLVDDVGSELADFDTLVDSITSIVAPDTWEEVGGTGSVVPFASRACLAISQTRDVHEKIQQQLNDLHMKYQDPNAAPKVSLAIADDKVITHVYKVPSKTGSEPQLQGAAGKAVNSQLGVGNFAVGELQPINTESLVFLIQTLVAKGSWHTSQDASIMSLPDRLLIRHRHDVQKEIQELLDQLSVSVLNPYGRNNRLQMSGVGCGGQGGGFGGGGFGGGGAF